MMSKSFCFGARYVIGILVSIALFGLSSQAIDIQAFVGPLQRNPYNQPQLLSRGPSGQLNIRNPQSGQMMSRYIPYYTDYVYQAMRQRTSDGNMRAILRSVLLSSHVAHTGQMDTLIQTCIPNSKDCYTQTPLGYERARLFLMGYFYLVKVGNQYAIKEAYCNKLYGPSDFKGKNVPGPNIVPDNNVINVEHTWPQSKFTGKYPTETQKSDLHHLFPTDSELNGVRGSFPFGEVDKDSEALKCGQSRFGINTVAHGPIFEPPDVHKGHVARALFYFALRYDMTIDPVQEAILRTWHQQFPVDTEELYRNDEIYKVQGNRNPFIDHPELVSTIRDF